MEQIEPSQSQPSNETPKPSLEEDSVYGYTMTNGTMLAAFSYFTGCDLFHKIALTSKQVRDILRNSGLLDQDKVIPAKSHQLIPPLSSLLYAIELANAI